jgi:hypothetical protein
MPWRRMGEWMYRSTFSLTSALAGGEWSVSPIGQEAGCAPEPVWTTWRRECSWPYRDLNSDLSVVHPVADRYAVWAIPAPSTEYTALYFHRGRFLRNVDDHLQDRMMSQLNSHASESILVLVTDTLLLLFILTANGFSPGGSGTTIRHNTHHTE